MQLFRFLAADDFEVVESPIATTQDSVSVTQKPAEKAAESVTVGTADASIGTEPVEAIIPHEAQVQIGEIRRQIENLTKKTSDRAVTHDRRVRTLEYCFDDCEAEILCISRAVEHVKKQIDGSAAKQEALDALRLSLEESTMLARDNSTRLDRIVVRYLPSIEAKVQVIKLDQEKWHVQTETSLRDLSDKLSGADLAHIRRIAEEADHRVRSVERRLSQLRAELLLAMALEAASVRQNAENERTEAAKEMDRLTKEHMDMWEDSRQLSLRVKRTEDIVQQLADTVVPVLEHRMQQQSLLSSYKEAEINGAANQADLREASLAARVQLLEEKLHQDAGVRLRLEALEKAVGILSAPAATPNVPPAPPTVDATGKAKRTLSHRINAEILRRAIRAELFNRGTRRQRTVAERLSAAALRACALRIAISAEIRRRDRRRGTPSSASLRAACVRRELRLEIARRQEAQHRRSGPLLAALRGACILRELRVEISRRQEAQHRTGPFVAAIRAACIRREIKSVIARRQVEIRRRLSAAMLRAGCLRRELRVEIAKRREAQHRTSPFTAALRVACIRRELRAEIAKREQAACHRCVPSATALRAGCLRRALRVEIAKRLEETQHRAGSFAVALRAACIRRELRIEITRRQRLVCRRNAPSATALRAACIRRELLVEVSRRREASHRVRTLAISKPAIKARAEIMRRAIVDEIARRKAVRAAAAAKRIADNGRPAEISVDCRSLMGEVAVNVQVPAFVTIRYLKQLIYFKGNCPLRPSAMNLVYAGRVLEDSWKVGGGVFTTSRPASAGCEVDDFTGIQSESTVLIIEKAL